MISIRPATPADVPAIQRITTASPTAPHWTTEQFRDSIAAPTTDSVQRIVLIAEGDESRVELEIDGFAVVSALVSIYPIEAELESIAVDPNHRGRGTGAALLQAVEDWLAALPSSGDAGTTLRLEVRTSNLPAIRLYRRSGFADVAIRPGYYANPLEDAIYMEKQIAPAMARTSDGLMHSKAPSAP
ncbi:acetyltransferase [Terriglobus roseus DSM 18391]|uniref:Acetyltransferase n=1 Tax=Terriglobus roseus (strain DSM 18391 / NRRL B-41598 / KBS 63) TaxID=926566 RepID=I3ZK57_TERRK|nr:GNAT family N-acetyltransferase [Terriglobus roseus]AFL89625.1 acetyltransferase [Terriglobus roseus DSM 18391]